MLPSPTQRPSQSILWIAVVVLLLAALGNHMNLQTCVGECCAVEALSDWDRSCFDREATAASDDAEDARCSCCSAGRHASDDGTPAGDAPVSASGTCAPGCCVTVAFDVDMAPVATPVQLPTLTNIAFVTTLPACRLAPAREVVRQRPFDRGPPRIDRRTALRACVVLLI